MSKKDKELRYLKDWKFTDTKTLIVLLVLFGLLFIDAIYNAPMDYIEI